MASCIEVPAAKSTAVEEAGSEEDDASLEHDGAQTSLSDGVDDGVDGAGAAQDQLNDSGSADSSNPSEDAKVDIASPVNDATADATPGDSADATPGDNGPGCAPGLPCDDGEPCTTSDKCSPKGVCVGGPDDPCDDDSSCTEDKCKLGYGCVHMNIAGACDDGDSCTEKDACVQGKCAGTAVGCDDGSPCTADSCDKVKGCVHTPVASACDDGNPCTQSDACDAGKCVSGANLCACQADVDCGAKEDGDLCNGTLYCDKSLQPFACKVKPATIVTCDTSKNNACSATGCDAGSGKCVTTAKPDATPCDADGSVCTANDTCMGGACVAGKVTACDDKNACTTDSCDPKAGCVFAITDKAACDDGSACTDKDACAGGKCVAGVALNCNDKNPCTTDSCDAKKGCDNVYNTLACDADGSTCTVNDACAGGKCVAGAALVCDDKNVCTTDSCDPKAGCVFANNGLGCDADGSVCTDKDACAGGKCVAGAALNCNDKNACTTDSCDPTKGCDNANNTLGCDADGSLCTDKDTCAAGKCVAGAALVCDDKNVCTTDSCDPKAGCVFANNGLGCDADGSVCTDKDACAGGKCVAGAALNCNDKNACTTDSCDPTKGCDNANNTLGCDADGSLCTDKDTCAAGKCVAGAALVCKDKNACTTDSCNFKVGCVFANNALACDADGSVCTDKDACAGGKCVPGAALSCDDKNVCTTDSCDATKGCDNVNNTVGCDADGSLCTDKDTCAAGKCVAGAALVCNDKNACTTDSCDPKVGCVFANNTQACDADGDACTQGDVCAAGKCVAGAKKSCDDSIPCTVDSCDKVTAACSSVSAVNGSGCDDGNACTTSDTCTNGSCVGPDKACNDKNPCTDDTCNPLNGSCTSVNNLLPCDDGDPFTGPDFCTGGTCKVNNVPTMTSATIEPNPFKTGDIASVKVAGWADKDGDTPGYVYAWFVASNKVATTSTLPSMTAKKGQSVHVKVWPFDGKIQGDPVVSPTVVVANTGPTAPSVEIQPVAADEDTDLTCKLAVAATDVDLDNITYTYGWTEDDVVVAAAAGLQTISGSLVSTKKWQCTVTASDGTAKASGTSQVLQPCALLSWYLDADGDGYGTPKTSQKACSQPKGYAGAGTDCNDADPAINPKAAEVCDGIDNNCDGVSDPPDDDVDGDGVPLCKGDCNDKDFRIGPNVPEICGNSIDDNCDGKTDVADIDGDGAYGCGKLPLDCNDFSALVLPGKAEMLGDGLDNDCNGAVDSPNSDDDGDGANETQGDCDDSAPWIFPGAFDVPDDGVDQDCSGSDATAVAIGDQGAIFLNPAAGSDLSPGTMANPVKTLTKAITLAAAGNRVIIATANPVAEGGTLANSLCGGYAADWKSLVGKTTLVKRIFVAHGTSRKVVMARVDAQAGVRFSGTSAAILYDSTATSNGSDGQDNAVEAESGAALVGKSLVLGMTGSTQPNVHAVLLPAGGGVWASQVIGPVGATQPTAAAGVNGSGDDCCTYQCTAVCCDWNHGKAGANGVAGSNVITVGGGAARVVRSLLLGGVGGAGGEGGKGGAGGGTNKFSRLYGGGGGGGNGAKGGAVIVANLGAAGTVEGSWAIGGRAGNGGNGGAGGSEIHVGTSPANCICCSGCSGPKWVTIAYGGGGGMGGDAGDFQLLVLKGATVRFSTVNDGRIGLTDSRLGVPGSGGKAAPNWGSGPMNGQITCISPNQGSATAGVDGKGGVLGVALGVDAQTATTTVGYSRVQFRANNATGLRVTGTTNFTSSVLAGDGNGMVPVVVKADTNLISSTISGAASANLVQVHAGKAILVNNALVGGPATTCINVIAKPINTIANNVFASCPGGLYIDADGVRTAPDELIFIPNINDGAGNVIGALKDYVGKWLATLATSTGINAGFPLTGTSKYGVVPIDVDGVLRPQGSGWDVGAYELKP
ncbi:MAG: hypothetical protein FJ100_15380 [Deltaproteobacteria bacterium]|nr:hypothetical protein [Deltaproteobacteria bacterium]